MRNKKLIGKIPNEYCIIKADFNASHYKIFYRIIQRLTAIKQKLESNNGIGQDTFMSNVSGDSEELDSVIFKEKEIKELFSKNLTSSEIEKVLNELIRSKIHYKDKKVFRIINVFDSVYYDMEDKTVQVYFTNSFLNALFETKNGFTLYNMIDISKLRSVYSIKLYLVGMKCRNLPKVIRNYEDFRTELDVPAYYKTCEVNRILNTAIKDIQSKTPLKITYKNITEAKKGKITHIEITSSYGEKLYYTDKTEQNNLKVAEQEEPW